VKWEMRDAQDKLVPGIRPQGSSGGAGPPSAVWITLSFDCTLQTRVSAAGWGFSVAALNENDPKSSWDIKPGETGEYFLGGTFTSDPPKEAEHSNGWKGTLKLPPMKITLTGK
jgi:hypothetical protein